MNFDSGRPFLKVKAQDLKPVGLFPPLLDIASELVADPILTDGFYCQLISGHPVPAMPDERETGPQVPVEGPLQIREEILTTFEFGKQLARVIRFGGLLQGREHSGFEHQVDLIGQVAH